MAKFTKAVLTRCTYHGHEVGVGACTMVADPSHFFWFLVAAAALLVFLAAMYELTGISEV